MAINNRSKNMAESRKIYYTHINFAFSLIDPTTFNLMPMDEDTGSLYDRVTALRARDPRLEVWIAIGGWAMYVNPPLLPTIS